jgi:hypothetical protein
VEILDHPDNPRSAKILRPRWMVHDNGHPDRILHPETFGCGLVDDAGFPLIRRKTPGEAAALQDFHIERFKEVIIHD